MSRRFIASCVFACGLANGLIVLPVRAQAPPAGAADDLPPDEDTSKVVKEYSFNPVQSKREVVAGNFYFKKGNYVAAVLRFTEATRWDSGNADAWLRLGDSQEKQRDAKAAKSAWDEYLKLAPHSKSADDVRKRMAKLKG